MSIISAYVREDWFYSVTELKTLFMFNTVEYKSQEDASNHLKRFIKELLSRNIIKTEKRSLSNEADIEFDNYDDGDLIEKCKSYKFEFVGIVVCQSRIIYIYPKYIGESSNLPLQVPKVEMIQVVKVIEKYSREKSKQDIFDIDLFVDEDNYGKINTLSVMLFLLDDYAANGLYETDETIIEINGNGNILWQKTVDETYPLISNNRPCYVELFTQRNLSDESDYLRRLHEYVITKCSHEVEIAGLTDFFCLPCAEISNDDESSFGDTGFILDNIDMAISNVFDDRKLLVLKALKLYFKSNKILVGDTELQLIGTRSFNLIWEEVCAKVFKSQKGDKRTRKPTVDDIDPKIDYSLINKKFDKKPPTLVELIKQPIWKRYNKCAKGIPKSTLNPDYLCFESNAASDNYIFYILDAKYYCPVWTNDTIRGQPGVDDVVKQYLYYLAYRDVLVKYNVKEVKNYFLMPKRECDSEAPGFVKLDILKQLGLGVVEVRMLSPVKMYKHYLNSTNMDLSELH